MYDNSLKSIETSAFLSAVFLLRLAGTFKANVVIYQRTHTEQNRRIVLTLLI